MMLYNHGYGSLQFKSLLFLFIISYCVAHNLIDFQYFQKKKKKKRCELCAASATHVILLCNKSQNLSENYSYNS